jgi:hypothetical protein
MKRLFLLFSVLLGVITTAESQTLEVQLHYTGSGTVDATHKIFVALWDSPDFTGGPPSEVKSTTSKDGTVTFSVGSKATVYTSCVFDSTGTWDGASGPPSGASVGMYSKAPPTPDPIAVTPQKVTKVTIGFDDTMKIP